jgi:hypothetical protein
MSRMNVSKCVYIIFCLLILVSSNLLCSQIKQSKNAIYFEALGVGGLYSINYERLSDDNNYGLRIGYSSWTMVLFGRTTFIGVPIMLNYLDGNKNHKLELGLGLEYVKVSGSEFWTNKGFSESGIIGISSFGYRYQPMEGGGFFRIVISPLYNFTGFHIAIGISFGACF